MVREWSAKGREAVFHADQGADLTSKGKLPEKVPDTHHPYVDEYLRNVGSENPYHPDIEDIYEGIQRVIEGRPFEQCAETPAICRFK